MKLIIQKTVEPSSIIADAEIWDIKEFLLNPDAEFDEDIEAEEETDFSEETEFLVEDETDCEEMTVLENDESYTIELSIPGFSKEDFIIEVSNDGILSINALSEVELYDEDESIRDFAEKTFNRAFRLPEDANCDEIQARYENGILALSVIKN